MAKKNKGKRLIATLYHKETGHFYTTERNVQNTQEKLRLKKYNPVLRKHAEYVEGKTA